MNGDFVLHPDHPRACFTYEHDAMCDATDKVWTQRADGSWECMDCRRIQAIRMDERSNYWECTSCGLLMHRQHMDVDWDDFGDMKYTCPGCDSREYSRGARDALDKALEALMRRCDQLYVEGRISTMGQAAIEATINALRGES